MHPTMITALAREVEQERQRDRRTAQLLSLALANRAQSVDGSHAARRVARRSLVGISLRPRVS